MLLNTVAQGLGISTATSFLWGLVGAMMVRHAEGGSGAKFQLFRPHPSAEESEFVILFFFLWWIISVPLGVMSNYLLALQVKLEESTFSMIWRLVWLRGACFFCILLTHISGRILFKPKEENMIDAGWFEMRVTWAVLQFIVAVVCMWALLRVIWKRTEEIQEKHPAFFRAYGFRLSVLNYSLLADDGTMMGATKSSDAEQPRAQIELPQRADDLEQDLQA